MHSAREWKHCAFFLPLVAFDDAVVVPAVHVLDVGLVGAAVIVVVVFQYNNYSITIMIPVSIIEFWQNMKS